MLQTLLTIGDYLLSPFTIERIAQVSAKAIDNNFYDLYELNDETVSYKSSAYSESKMINSILLKTDQLNKKLIESLYADYDTEKINFIVSYTKKKKYFINFSIVESHENLIEETLHYLKNNQHEIERWFDERLESLPNFQKEGSTIFPEYDIPGIPVEINNKKASLVKTSLNKIYIKLSEMVSFEQDSTIKFSLGPKTFQYRIEDLNQLSDDTLCASLVFDTKKKYEDWKNFTIAMQMRLKKSNQ